MFLIRYSESHGVIVGVILREKKSENRHHRLVGDDRKCHEAIYKTRLYETREATAFMPR